MAIYILPGEKMVIRPLQKRFSLFRGRLVRVLKGSTKKSERLPLDFFGGLVGYICTPGLYVSRDDQFVTQLPLVARHAWEARIDGGRGLQTCTTFANFSQTQPDIFAKFLHIFNEV